MKNSIQRWLLSTMIWVPGASYLFNTNVSWWLIGLMVFSYFGFVWYTPRER